MCHCVQPIESVGHCVQPIEPVCHGVEPIELVCYGVEAIESVCHRVEPIESVTHEIIIVVKELRQKKIVNVSMFLLQLSPTHSSRSFHLLINS